MSEVQGEDDAARLKMTHVFLDEATTCFIIKLSPDFEEEKKYV